MTSEALLLSPGPTERTIAASTDPPVDEAYRTKIREAIHDGLSSLRWGWPQSMAPTLRKELGSEEHPLLTSALIKEIIADAEQRSVWPMGWAEEQLAEARAVQRCHRPKNRYRYVARGEQIGKSKLTDQGVRSIRRRYANRRHRKVTIKRLAQEHGVNAMTIRRVLRRESWAHVK